MTNESKRSRMLTILAKVGPALHVPNTTSGRRSLPTPDHSRRACKYMLVCFHVRKVYTSTDSGFTYVYMCARFVDGQRVRLSPATSCIENFWYRCSCCCLWLPLLLFLVCAMKTDPTCCWQTTPFRGHTGHRRKTHGGQAQKQKERQAANKQNKKQNETRQRKKQNEIKQSCR